MHYDSDTHNTNFLLVKMSTKNVRVYTCFPDRVLRSWGLHEIPKFQGLREITGYTFPVTYTCLKLHVNYTKST